jgi:hypothetical protein
MALTLNNIWDQFNRLVQSISTTDIDRKINALNIAQRYLIERTYQLGKRIDLFLSDPTNVSNTIDTNYIACPDDFLALHKAWYRSGTSHVPFGKNSYITYNDLLDRAGESFFDTTANGGVNLIAVKEPYIYFDQHFDNTFTDDETITGGTSGVTATVDSVSGTTLTYSSASGSFTDGEVITGSTSGTTATIGTITATTMVITITGGTKEIKLSYVKYPADVVYYDSMVINTATGTFTVGEIIEGQTSNASATVLTATTTAVTITDRDGTFTDGETLQGVISSYTAVLDGDVTTLPQTLIWTEKYKYILTEAWALIWEHMKGANNVPARSDIVDGLIEMMTTLNRGDETTSWSIE